MTRDQNDKMPMLDKQLDAVAGGATMVEYALIVANSFAINLKPRNKRQKTRINCVELINAI